MPEWIDLSDNEVEIPEIENIPDKEENDDENSDYLELIKAFAALKGAATLNHLKMAQYGMNLMRMKKTMD